MPGIASTAKFFAKSVIASGVASQSIIARAASTFFVFFMMPLASRSQPSPSVGKMMSMGAPDFFVVTARYSNDTPIGNSPAPAWRHGCEPECVYIPIFSCSASMNFQASASPHIRSQPATSRQPVPDDARRIAHPFKRDIRIRLVERLLVRFDLIGLERRVDEELGLLRQCLPGPERCDGNHRRRRDALPPFSND